MVAVAGKGQPLCFFQLRTYAERVCCQIVTLNSSGDPLDALCSPFQTSQTTVTKTFLLTTALESCVSPRLTPRANRNNTRKPDCH